jgi:hypothetical protein
LNEVLGVGLFGEEVLGFELTNTFAGCCTAGGDADDL